MDSSSSRPQPFSNLSREEWQHFENLSQEWWDEGGPFAALHQINKARLTFILEAIAYQKELPSNLPLRTLRILDVGCGGGLLCEPLSRLGADVTGLDAVQSSIDVARAHALLNDLPIHYINATIETHHEAPFDVVIAMEVLEHVDDPSLFLQHCARLTKPEGCLILSTLNQTLASWVMGIFMAERVLKWVPQGTHQWSKFFHPRALEEKLYRLGFEEQIYQGICFNPFSGQWNLSQNLSVNYCAAAFRQKNGSPKKHFSKRLDSWG